jgi:hypothetical protein
MENSEELAEIIGIMLGDGCLFKGKKKGNYQIIITSGKNERDWINYVRKQFSNYFKKEFKIIEIKFGIQAKIGSKEVFEHLLEKGLHHGNKVHNRVTIPSWVFEKNKFLVKTVQGLFDTDGSVYKKYAHYAQIEFKFGCIETTTSVCEAVRGLGFNPTKIQKQHNKATGRYLWRFYLSRQGEIDSFFKIVKPKNQKHIERFNKIRKVGIQGFEP